MRLIDADNKKFDDESFCVQVREFESITVVPIEIIREAQTVDAVEVVRCKDCDYRILDLCTKICRDGITRKDVFCKRKKDDFCNYGHKKR